MRASLRFLRYQDDRGRLPLSNVDPDARWRKIGSRPTVLGYKENLIVDRSGFILARGVTPADASDVAGLEPLLSRLPFKPRSLCGDTGYRSLRLRFLLRRQGIEHYMPLHPKEADASALLDGAFSFHGDHLSCRAGKVPSIGRFPDDKDVIQYVARETECRVCPVKGSCLAPKERYKHVAASRYHYGLIRARRINQTRRFAREMSRRKTAVEGVFAHLDRLAWDKARLRGIPKVDIQGAIAALAHNILKALGKRRFFRTVAASSPIPPRPNCLARQPSLHPWTQPSLHPWTQPSLHPRFPLTDTHPPRPLALTPNAGTFSTVRQVRHDRGGIWQLSRRMTH